MESTKPAATDLDDVVESDAQEMELQHPNTGAGMGIYFTLAGPEHPVRRSFLFKTQREQRQRFAKMKAPNIGKMLADGDPEDEEAQATDYLVLCTLGWRDLKIAGADVPFSKDAARAIYSDPKRAYVRRQVKAFLEDAANFISTSSSG